MAAEPSAPWGHDVVLADGSTARIRYVTIEDGPAVAALHGRLSPETVRLRYFGAHPHLSEVELDSVVSEAEPDHLVLVAERGGQLIGIAQYDRIPGSDVAEVAFVVDDAHQGLGIGTLLLEYLASEGRRNGLKRFAADTLLENNAMVQVFRDAGFTQHSNLESGVIRVVMDIAPTLEALASLYERDRKAVGTFDGPLVAASLDRRHRGVPLAGHRRPRARPQPGQWRLPGPCLPREPERGPHRERALLCQHRRHPWGCRPSGGRRPGDSRPGGCRGVRSQRSGWPRDRVVAFRRRRRCGAPLLSARWSDWPTPTA